MDDLRGLGYRMVGWVFFVAGILGTIFLVLLVLGSLAVYFFADGEERMGFMGIFAAPFFIPFPILFFVGRKMLKKQKGSSYKR